jgi:phenylacetate-CoA ligase
MSGQLEYTNHQPDTKDVRPGRVVPMGRLLLGVAERLRGTQTLALLRSIEAAPFASRTEIETQQFQKLSALLAHAEAKVPYYREMFRSLGIHSSDIRNLKDFSELPVLTKKILRERPEDLRAEGFRPKELVKHHSGGSTGIPVTFYHDRRSSLDASDAGTYRNLKQSGWQPGEMIALFYCAGDKVNNMSRLEFECRQILRRIYQFDPSHAGPKHWDRWLKRWRTLDVKVALGYPSALARFAEYIESSGRRLSRLRGVYTSGEKLYPQQRDVIARVFGSQVFDSYGCSEVRNISAECSRGNMHINEDFVVLEVDKSTIPGTPEPFIMTSLWNYGMPFIRYRNEDCGGLLSETCDCGNNFRLMKLDIARSSDNFILPDGSVVHGQFFTWLMYGSKGIASFQFHQTAPDAITFWVVPAKNDSESREECIREAVNKIKRLTTAEMKIEVREVEEIPLTAAGKHRFTRSSVTALSFAKES